MLILLLTIVSFHLPHLFSHSILSKSISILYRGHTHGPIATTGVVTRCSFGHFTSHTTCDLYDVTNGHLLYITTESIGISKKISEKFRCTPCEIIFLEIIGHEITQELFIVRSLALQFERFSKYTGMSFCRHSDGWTKFRILISKFIHLINQFIQLTSLPGVHVFSGMNTHLVVKNACGVTPGNRVSYDAGDTGIVVVFTLINTGNGRIAVFRKSTRILDPVPKFIFADAIPTNVGTSITQNLVSESFLSLRFHKFTLCGENA